MVKPAGDNWHRVASYSELEDREPLPVDIMGEEIALILLDDELHAIANICTHEYACLSDGFVEDTSAEPPDSRRRLEATSSLSPNVHS